MTLTLYYHPLSSFCQKALIALYETGAPFTRRSSTLRERRPPRGLPEASGRSESFRF